MRKLNMITIKLRQLCAAYESDDSSQMIRGKVNIARFIISGFTDAMLKNDLDGFMANMEKKNLDKYIYEEARIFDYEKVMRKQKFYD